MKKLIIILLKIKNKYDNNFSKIIYNLFEWLIEKLIS